MKLTKKLVAIVLAALMAVSMMPLTAFADDLSDLKGAMTTYESMMANSNVYKNMKNAYDAYVTACSVYYSGDAASAATAKANLVAATNAMTVWSQATTNTYATNDDNKVYSDDSYNHNSDYWYGDAYYKQAIWLQTGVNADNGSHKSSDNSVQDWFRYPAGVFLYDGTNQIKSTIVMASKGGGSQNKNRYLVGAIVENSDLELVNSKWYGNGSSYDANWMLSSFHEKELSSKDSLTEAYQVRKKGTFSGSDLGPHHFANIISYKGTLTSSDSGVVSVTPVFKAYYNSETAWKTDDGLNGSVTGNRALYIINYKKLLDKINATKSFDITNYKKDVNGDASAFFTAYDKLTAVDPNNAMSGATIDNYGTKASDLGAAIDTAVSGMSGKSLTADTYTVTFSRTDNTAVAPRNIAVGGKLGELPGNSNPSPITGTNKHNVYSWGGITKDTVVEYDTSYAETANETDCTFAEPGTYHPETATSIGYTEKSCVCGNSQKVYDSRDFTAYNLAVENAELNIANDNYTEDSRATYAQQVAEVKLTNAQLADETLPQATINAATAAIEGKFSILVEVPKADNTYNLTVDDGIDVNFNIDTEFYEADGGTITYSYLSNTEEQSSARIETTVYVDQIEDSTGHSAITIPAAPAQIAEPYVITVTRANGTVADTITTSIQKYCQDILDAPLSVKITQADKDVAQALLNYGAIANEYFDYASKTTGSYTVDHSPDYKVLDDDLETIRSKAKAKFTTGADASGKNINITAISYVALLDPEFRFYVSQDNEVWAAMTDVTVLEGDVTAKMVKIEDTDKFCVVVKGLKANEFGKKFTIKIGEAVLEYNGYAYLYTVLTSTSTAQNLKELATGVYNYAAACEARYVSNNANA